MNIIKTILATIVISVTSNAMASQADTYCPNIVLAAKEVMILRQTGASLEEVLALHGEGNVGINRKMAHKVFEAPIRESRQGKVEAVQFWMKQMEDKCYEIFNKSGEK